MDVNPIETQKFSSMMAASGIDDDLSSKIGASKAQFLLKSVGQAVHSVGSAFFTSMTEVISYRFLLEAKCFFLPAPLTPVSELFMTSELI